MFPTAPLPLSVPAAEQWMAQALELAQQAAIKDEVPVGAILVYENEIIGAGSNARERSGRVVAHAEIVALEDYSQRTGQWRLPRGAILVSTAEPCLMCTGALLWARADRIIYGCSDPKKAGLERMLPSILAGVFDHQFSEVRGGVLADRCAQLLSAYFKNKRRDENRKAVVPQFVR